MKHSTRNAIAKQAAILGITGIIVRIIGLLYRIPLSNIIGDIGNNYYGIVFNIYTLLLYLSGFGVPSAISKLISTYRAKKQYKNAYKVFLASLIFVTCISTFLAIVLYTFAPHFLPIGNEKAVYALRALAPTLIFSGFIGVFQGYFHARRNSIPTAIAQFCDQIINALTSILFAFIFTRYVIGNKIEVASLGALGSTLGTLFGAVTSTIILFLIFRLNLPKQKREVLNDKSYININTINILKQLIFLVTPIILANVIMNMLEVIDQFIYFSILTYKNNNIVDVINHGIYVGKILPLHSVPLSISTSIALSTLPTISTAIAKNKRYSTYKTITESITLSMLFTIPSSVGLFVLAKPIMNFLFPNTSSVGYIGLRIICILIIIKSYSVVLYGVIQGLGKPIYALLSSLISVIIHLIFLAPLLYFTNLGIYAILISNIVSALTQSIIYYLSIKKLIKYRQNFIHTLLLPILASILMGIFTYFIFNFVIFILKFNILGLFITIPLSIIFYSMCILKLNFISISELQSISIGRLFVKFLRKLRFI